jgi:hypothetical protein
MKILQQDKTQLHILRKTRFGDKDPPVGGQADKICNQIACFCKQ